MGTAAKEIPLNFKGLNIWIAVMGYPVSSIIVTQNLVHYGAITHKASLILINKIRHF